MFIHNFVHLCKIWKHKWRKTHVYPSETGSICFSAECVCVSHGISVLCGMFVLCTFMCFMVWVGVVHACECVGTCTHMISSCSHFHEGSIISFCTEEDKILLAAYTTSIYLFSSWWIPWLVSWPTQCKALQSTLVCKYLGDKLSWSPPGKCPGVGQISLVI